MQTAITSNEQLAAQTRLALRRLASAVAVVSCRDGQTRHAMTATAVNAMSMDPPSMIVCVNRATTFHGAISAATRFAINILHRSQIEISIGCGGKTRGDDRFGERCLGRRSRGPNPNRRAGTRCLHEGSEVRLRIAHDIHRTRHVRRHLWRGRSADLCRRQSTPACRPMRFPLPPFRRKSRCYASS